ncbi:eukaryotic peptide chain release factor subunit 1 [Phakopsora pachyrhizi]|uniref:Eukaryotic peptide chain release factor subunit 1 n=1 Tax=Phakopsora pachyrhizi TaxID=170000 RepID=A0AAV0ANA6_PHAPC|nr:eukaryotic peptide chain release factor subunit 1 [Phakopsora pachyrhizi]
MASQPNPSEAEQNIQMWKIKKLVKSLEAARGAGTSMISLILPPKSQLSQAQNMLAHEYGTASNIKSRVNRLSVLAAITSTQQRLKLYTKVPPNGLIVYCGTILTDEGKEKKVNFDFEPFKPINTSLYLCDNKFHTEALSELLESDSKFGFIVMDGNGSLFGTLAGNTRDVIHKFTVDLPKKHGRGGQSALRFARLREEKRHNYVRKVAEYAVQHFITNDKVNVQGLVLAGSADFKTELSQSDMFDPRLAAKVIKIVDVSYGGENGFNQAIELAAESLSQVKFIQEKKLIQKYFDEIALDTGKYCFGVEDTLRGLELGAVETLIVWENLDITRHTLRSSTGETVIVHTVAPPPTASNNTSAGQPNQAGNVSSALAHMSEKDREKFIDKATGLEMEQASEPQSLLEWLAEKYQDFGAALEFVTNKSTEGSQFVRGFGGIGGVLRYKVDFGMIADMIEDGEEGEFMTDSDD